MSREKSRVEYIDLFRAIGIILMIMGHIKFGSHFDKWIHAFHMPMFFFISGWFYRRKDSVGNEIIGKIRDSLKRVFNDLILTGVGNDPLSKGSFYFQKGTVQDFHYKNLSAGEKSAFDLILDLIVKSNSFPNAVYCIDEPEAHMHTHLQ